MRLRCLCGGALYTRAELIEFAEPDVGWDRFWASVMGPYDLYCAEDDEVLTEDETWRVRGLQTPVHDDLDPADCFDFELVADALFATDRQEGSWTGWTPRDQWLTEVPMICDTCGDQFMGRELMYIPNMCANEGCPGPPAERTFAEVAPLVRSERP